jgi:hypothetical protein
MNMCDVIICMCIGIVELEACITFYSHWYHIWKANQMFFLSRGRYRINSCMYITRVKLFSNQKAKSNVSENLGTSQFTMFINRDIGNALTLKIQLDHILRY